MRGGQSSKGALVFRSYERNLELATVVIVYRQLVGGKEYVGIVCTKEVAADHNLHGLGSGHIVLINYGEVNGK